MHSFTGDLFGTEKFIAKERKAKTKSKPHDNGSDSEDGASSSNEASLPSPDSQDSRYADLLKKKGNSTLFSHAWHIIIFWSFCNLLAGIRFDKIAIPTHRPKGKSAETLGPSRYPTTSKGGNLSVELQRRTLQSICGTPSAEKGGSKRQRQRSETPEQYGSDGLPVRKEISVQSIPLKKPRLENTESRGVIDVNSLDVGELKGNTCIFNTTLMYLSFKTLNHLQTK